MLGWICTLTGHRRVKKRVWNDGHDWRTNCTRCGKPMVRGANRRWTVDPDGPARRTGSGPS